jgi:hypothetical protein
VEYGYDSASIPDGPTINSMTVYMGYYSESNWGFAVGYTGLVWETSSGGTQYDISYIYHHNRFANSG